MAQFCAAGNPPPSVFSLSFQSCPARFCPVRGRVPGALPVASWTRPLTQPVGWPVGRGFGLCVCAPWLWRVRASGARLRGWRGLRCGATKPPVVVQILDIVVSWCRCGGRGLCPAPLRFGAWPPRACPRRPICPADPWCPCPCWSRPVLSLAFGSRGDSLRRGWSRAGPSCPCWSRRGWSRAVRSRAVYSRPLVSRLRRLVAGRCARRAGGGVVGPSRRLSLCGGLSRLSSPVVRIFSGFAPRFALVRTSRPRSV